MLSTCDCGAVSRPHLMISVFLCSRSSLSRNVSSLLRPFFRNRRSVLTAFSRYKYSTSLFNFARLCCVGFDILRHSWFTMNVMSARPRLRNKHLATCDLYLPDCIWSDGAGSSSVRHVLSYHVRARDLSRARQHVRVPQCTLRSKASMISVDSRLALFV